MLAGAAGYLYQPGWTTWLARSTPFLPGRSRWLDSAAGRRAKDLCWFPQQ